MLGGQNDAEFLAMLDICLRCIGRTIRNKLPKPPLTNGKACHITSPSYNIIMKNVVSLRDIIDVGQ